MAEVLLTIRCRVLRLLARRRVIETADELELLPSDETERDPVLAQSLRRLLIKLCEPAEMQGKSPAQPPPYFASKVVRRHFGQPDPQLAMVH